MRNYTIHLFLFFWLMISVTGRGQDGTSLTNYTSISSGESMEEIIRKAAYIVPSYDQLEWQRMEFIGFAHFGMDTYTDKEWGEGNEDPSLFNPEEFDAEQWVRTFKDGGMKMLIIIAKHHDGFCLWPSKYTNYSVKKSPWRKGKGDLVGELVAACHANDMKVGIYLSPWDRHEQTYGNSPLYNKFFLNQLRELLTNYGEITEVWFDGASLEGPNGKKQEYDWPAYFDLIRKLQPHALIVNMGPDIRWVGNESGNARESEWSVIPVATKAGISTIPGDDHPVDKIFQSQDVTAEDLCNAENMTNKNLLLWYPAEADVSIRPGWFYHSSEDSQVKTPEQLVNLYFKSVGRNAVMLLNIPPDKRGLITDQDMKNLHGMKRILDFTFRENIAKNALMSYENPNSEKPYFFTSNNNIKWTARPGNDSSVLLFNLHREVTFNIAMIQETIKEGQRIAKFRMEWWDGKSWLFLSHGTTIGYKRLLKFAPVKTDRVRLIIEQSRALPSISAFGLYKLPENFPDQE